MQPTPTAPRETPAEGAATLDPTIAAPRTSEPDAPLADTEPTSGPAGSTFEDYKKKATDGIQSVLDSSKQALDKSKQWLDESDLAGKAKELPQKAKELGSKALDEINGLSTTQKALGVGLIAAGVALLIVRGQRRKQQESEYRKRPQKSPFSKNSYGRSEEGYGRGNQRPWGSSRYGQAGSAGGRPRVISGSGYASAAPDSGARRDQGPASGSRYDVNTSGQQNPNNLDDVSSAF